MEFSSKSAKGEYGDAVYLSRQLRMNMVMQFTFQAARVEYGDAGKSKGEEGQAGPAGFSSWISRELGRAEALLKVVGSRPDTLADNFFTLMPSGTLPDYQRIIDLKVCFVSTLACLH